MKALSRFGPLSQAIAVYATVLALGGWFREACVLWAALGLACFSIAAPLMATRNPHFWRTLGVTFVAWWALLLGLLVSCEALLGHKVGDDAMVFLLPMMLYPAALLVASILHVVLKRRAPPAG